MLLIFWIGLYPSPFLSRMEASVDGMTREYTAKLKASDANPNRRSVASIERVTMPAGAAAEPTPSGAAP